MVGKEKKYEFKKNWNEYAEAATEILGLENLNEDSICPSNTYTCKAVYHCTCPRFDIDLVKILKNPEVVTDKKTNKNKFLCAKCNSQNCKHRYDSRQVGKKAQMIIDDSKKDSLFEDASEVPKSDGMNMSNYPYLEERLAFQSELEGVTDKFGYESYQAPFSYFSQIANKYSA